MKRLLAAVCAGAALLCTAAPLRAQADAEPVSPWRPLRIAKWTGVTGTAALALYGFTSNRSADDLYESIERVCANEPLRCTNRRDDGSYVDAALEADYQRVRTLDRHARTALITSQVGLAASAILFILDLRNNRPPDNIPYEPRRLEIGTARDGGISLSLRVRVGRAGASRTLSRGGAE